MTEEDSPKKDATLKKRFRDHVKRHWKYTRKWFPFAIVIGLISGVIMALFTSLVFNIPEWLSFGPSYVKYLLYPVVGGITSLFLYFGFKEVYGAGLSHVLAHKNSATPLRSRGILTKFFTSVLTLGIGAPGGREGPSVTIGSTVSSVIGDKLGMTKEDEMHAITIGAAACTAAVFQAPLGGTVFATEVPYKRDLDETVFLPALVASAISFLVYNGLLIVIQKIPFLSESPVLLVPVPEGIPLTFVNSLHFLLFGIFAGLIGICFSVLFNYISKGFNLYIKKHFLPIIGISITAIIVFLVDDFWLPKEVQLEGTGFNSINYLLSLEDPESIGIWILFVLLIGKIIVTSTCIGFGNSAGVMGPSLVTGAALGLLYSRIFPSLSPHDMMIIGMSAMHTSTTKTPIASMILVLEMVGFPNLVIPIILSNIMAFIISGDFSLYKGQIQSKEVILRRTIQNTDILELITVKEAMDKDAPNIKENDLLEETFHLLASNRRSALTVIDQNGELCGIISTSDFQRGILQGKTYVHEVMTKEVICVNPDEKLSSAFDKLTDHRIEYLPVVDPKYQKKILGVISFVDIEKFYEKKLIEIQKKKSVTIEEILDDV